MKSVATKCGFFVSLLMSFSLSAFAQIPQGFNYQAIARDGSGEILANKSLPIRITLQTTQEGGTLIYEEEFLSVTSDQFGLITLVVGTGTQIDGKVDSFSEIDWKTQPLFLKTTIQYPGSTWTEMGTSQLWSVPYAMMANDVGTLSKLGITSASANDDALFEVKNKGGQTVFAVYNNAVRAYVGKEITKGARGGFSVGGYDGTKGVQDYLKVYGDSTRIYVKNPKKGARGGFAVGGYDGTKGITGEFMNLTKENYLIGHESGKNLDGGLYNSFLGYQAGYNTTTGYKNYFIGYMSGFNNTSGYSNTFIGDSAGFKNSTGYWNTFIGDWTGYKNTTGYKNLFIGHRAGASNISGICNIFLGPDAGSSNSTAWYNTFVGIGAGAWTTTGGYNSYYGINSGMAMKSGSNNAFYGSNSGYWFDGGSGNTFIGAEAGRGGPDDDPPDPPGDYNTLIGSFTSSVLENAYYNTIVGSFAGGSLRTGQRNVFLGYSAGSYETGSDKLYIANSESNPPLLYGDFSLKQLGINTKTLTKTLNVGGDVSVSGNVTATTLNGTLTGNVSGNVSGAVTGSLTGPVTGNVTGDVTGNLTGNVNGATMGKVFFNATSGIVVSVYGGKYDLYWDNAVQTLTLRNTHGSNWCWFTVQKMPLADPGTLSYVATGFRASDGNRLVVTFSNNGDACVISFGDQYGVNGYCTVWLQYSSSRLFGHYIKY
jgi:hypothetical protein